MARIEFRCSVEQKTQWEAKADRLGISLADLCRTLLCEAKAPRGSEAAAHYRRLSELLVLVVQRLDEMGDAFASGNAPRDVLLLYLSHVYHIHEALREIPKTPVPQDEARDDAAADGEPTDGSRETKDSV